MLLLVICNELDLSKLLEKILAPFPLIFQAFLFLFVHPIVKAEVLVVSVVALVALITTLITLFPRIISSNLFDPDPYHTL